MDLAKQDGGTRLDVWLEESPRHWREVLGVFVEVGRSLAAAHSKGAAHQEVRMDNIFIGRGHAELRDVKPAVKNLPRVGPAGLRTAAVSLEDRLADVRSAEAAAYLAPEQFKGWVADSRTNQFSFCVALYRALYRQMPFDHDWALSQQDDNRARRTPLGSIHFDLVVRSLDRKSMIDLAREVLSGNLRPPPEDTDVPGVLELILQRGLRSDPDDRYQTMRELLDDLTAVLKRSSRKSAQNWARINPVSQRQRRNETLTWAIVGGIGLLLVLGFAAKLSGLIP